MSYEYEKNGSKIYDKSFAIIRNESDLSNFKNGEEKQEDTKIMAQDNR